MAGSKHIRKISAVCFALALLLTILFINGEALGVQALTQELGYVSRLFDTGRVHTIDIVIDGWDSFISTCENEAYTPCCVVIDGEAYQNTGLRAKGNTSLRLVSQMDSSRYSFKLEFDHYDSGKTYYGLDKLCLNNLIQDNTCMKDYLTYQLMAAFGVDAPLCSYVYLTVNGEDWGLYLAVEGVEEGFLQRNYGSGYGALYKPDSADFGGTGSSDVKLQYIDSSPDSYANIFNSAKTDITAADQQRLIASLKALQAYEDLDAVLDIDQVLRYLVVHSYVVNDDSYTGSMVHNYYLYEQDGKLSMIPWDYNLAFGTFQAGDAGSAVNSPIDEVLTDRPMQAWIFSDEAYTAMYHSLFAEFLEGIDTDAIIGSAYDLIAPYVEQDPTKFCTYEAFETGVQTLRSFCALRTRSVQGQLSGSVPSTEAAQRMDPSALIAAPQLLLSDMGAMDGAGEAGGFPGGEFSPGAFPLGDEEATPASGNPPEQMPADRDSPPMQRDPFSAPNGQRPTDQPAKHSLLLMGVSCLVLLLGIIFAKRFRC